MYFLPDAKRLCTCLMLVVLAAGQCGAQQTNATPSNADTAASAVDTATAAASVSGSAESLQAREQSRVETIARIAPTVVCVMPPDGQGGGSGVLISADGYAVSNYHVTSGSGNFMKCGLNDGKVYDAVIVGIDPTGDVALIKLLGRDDFPFCTPGNSDAVRVGDEVMALGNPFLLASDFTPTVTYGIVSGVQRYQYPANTFLEYTDCIQIDASINPGNSGGPLFDIAGRWIGINGRASFEKRGRVNTGAAYAISSRQVLLFLEHLKSGRIVDHGRTEFTVKTTDSGLVRVDQISQISEPWRRGLREGDELVSFAGRALRSANDFKNVLGILPEGSRVPYRFRNSEGLHQATVRLLPLHGFDEAPQLPEERRPQRPDPEPQEEEGEDPQQPEDHHHSEPKKTDGPQVPEQWAHLFQQRKGFANYYFNQQWQQRLLQPLRQQSESSGGSANWVLDIRLEAATQQAAGELGVTEQAAYLQLRGQRSALQKQGQFSLQDEPDQFPGLLVGMLQLRQLLQSESDTFDDLFYHGDERLQPSQATVRTLITIDGTIKSRWYFQDGNVYPVGVDILPAAGVDEARLRFTDWEAAAGDVAVPRRIGRVIPETEQLQWLDVQAVRITQPPRQAEAGRNEPEDLS